MNLEQKKLFVELVKAGAPLKAYQKKLGLNKEGLQLHLGKLAEYEEDLKPKKTASHALSEAKKVKPEDIAHLLGAVVTKPAPEYFGSSKLKEKFDKASEPEKEEEDEEDNTA